MSATIDVLRELAAYAQKRHDGFAVDVETAKEMRDSSWFARATARREAYRDMRGEIEDRIAAIDGAQAAMEATHV